jgi:hypothetical protein
MTIAIASFDEGSPANWTAADLAADRSWVTELGDRARADLVRTVKGAVDPDRTLLDYRRAEFDLGAAHAPITQAFHEAKHGRGIALLRGLPRADLTEEEFALLTWAVGLHVGVARPQGKATQYLSGVRNVGVDYRSSSGRGYSSNAELDFHIDGVDVVALACFNRAVSGGMSLVTSSLAAFNRLVAERPDVVETLREPFFFSRQAEEAPDEAPFYDNPVFDTNDGRFYGKWNRNRIMSAQSIDGVPKLTDGQREAMEVIDATLRRPDLMFTMFLDPGDMQILSNFTTLHSRTTFVDQEDEAQRRLLYRLWITPPDAPELPPSWKPLFRSVRARTVRGGIIGHNHDDRCRAFDARQAAEHHMLLD